MTTNQMTANETYHQRMREATGELARIAGLLAIHARRQSRDPGNWGFAGDLGFIHARLAEIVGCFGIDPKHRCDETGCNERGGIVLTDGKIVCLDHAAESCELPEDCLDTLTGKPCDQDD